MLDRLTESFCLEKTIKVASNCYLTMNSDAETCLLVPLVKVPVMLWFYWKTEQFELISFLQQ